MRFFALGIFTSLTLVLSACGDDKEPISSATNTTPATTTNNSTTDNSGSSGSQTTDNSGTGTTTSPTTTSPTTGETTVEPGTTTSTTTPETTTGEPGSTGNVNTTVEPGSTGGTTGGGGAGDYEACSNEKMIECESGFCIDAASTMDTVKGAFCSPKCSGPGKICPKPDGLDPSVQPLCAFDTDMDMSADICALVCNLDNDKCPQGSTCEDIGIPPMGMPPMNFGVCTYPAP